MENSHLITKTDPFEDLRVFVNGYDGERRASAHIASTLENVALHQGWPVGQFVGSETELMQRFDVSRDALREAIRIVETHGAMHMQRGCKGGLHLASPNLDQAAGALTAYLRACGCGHTELAATAAIAAPIFGELRNDNLFICLFRRTLEIAADGAAPNTDEAIRATVIATQLVPSDAAIPAHGVALGSEAELCEKFNCCRSTLRQALRILDDLEVLQVRRGRGGGYSLKPPASNGIARQLFAFIASRRQTLEHTVTAMWALNLVNLRLAMRRLRDCDAATKSAHSDYMSKMLAATSEPKRWALLQYALAQLANNTLIETLQRCLVAYQARLGPPSAAYHQLDRELRIFEEAIVQALRDGAETEAETQQRQAQARLSQLLNCPDLPTQ